MSSKVLRNEMRFNEFVTCYEEQWQSNENYKYLKPRKYADYVVMARLEYKVPSYYDDHYTIFIYKATKVKIGCIPKTEKDRKRGYSVKTEKRYKEIMKIHYDPVFDFELQSYDEEMLFKFAEKMLEAYNLQEF